MRSLILLFGVILGLLPAAVGAAGVDIFTYLEHHDAYVSSKVIAAGHATKGDAARLDAQARTAAGKGVPEKFAILSSYPSNYSAAQAADALRNSISFSGVLVLVAPGHIALSSDRLSQSEMNSIAAKAAPRCGVETYSQCALLAGQQAVARVRADQNSSGQSSGMFWLIVIAIVAVVAFFILPRSRRRGRGAAAASPNLADLRTAADNTLGQADRAVQQVESAVQGGKKLPRTVQAEFDRALALRETASQELKQDRNAAMLVQANQDAAHAVLALQGIMRSIGVEDPLSNPLETPMHRCFYCGHTDRPPYTTRAITDDRGNSMQVEVCAVDEERLQRGQRPEVSTVQYNGAPVPWYAIPGNPWYYAYGGPTWQYWLPFMLGMDVGSWFGGGWGWGGGYDWDGGMGGGWGGMGADPGSAVPSDAGQADFGGGWDTGGGFDSGGGWDSGGGADFGGGDFGGGDSGWS
jgi:hypothetical protein